MKRYLQRDRSQLSSRFEVYGDRGELVCRVNGTTAPSGEYMRIRDTEDVIVCKIRRLGFSALAAYRIRCGDCTARLNIAVSGGTAAVRYGGISFCVRGDVLSGSYDIIDADGTLICAVNKDYAKGCTTLNIGMEAREMLCIASAVCIDSLTLDRRPALQMT